MNNFPVPQEAVEAGLLNAVNQNLNNWIQISSFEMDDFIAHKQIFRFMGEYLAEYGSLPSNSQIGTRFTWSPPIGDFAYWLVEMKRYSLSRKVMDIMKSGFETISNPQSAMNMVIEKLSVIRANETTHIQAYDTGAMERLEKFDLRTEYIFNTNSMLGLKTGMKIIDETNVGWIPGSLVGAYSRPGVGKTWWLMWQGALAWEGGHKVLSLTPEMPANMLSLRIDVVLGNLLGYDLDYNKIMRGDPSVRDPYSMALTDISSRNSWWNYDSLNDKPFDLGDIAALIRQHRPELVLIDGISLLRAGGSSRQTWEQIKDNSYGLKNLATIYDLPIIITHQAVNSNRGRRGSEEEQGRGDDFHMPSLNDAAYGDAFVQACSDIITFCGDPGCTNVNWYSIRKHRERGWTRPLPIRMGLAVHFGKGKVIDLSEMGYDPAGVGAAARRLLGVL